MKNLITLVKMQLKEKLNIKRRGEGTRKFDLFVSVLGHLLKFILVTALCTVIIFALNFLVFGNMLPISLVSLVLVIMLLLSVFSCTVGLTKAMYFSHDNSVLLTLPCTPSQIYFSKLVIFTFFELKKNFSFIVPFLIGYFIVIGYPWYFYLWMLVAYLFISIFTVAIGALLSIPTMWISCVFRQHRTLQIVTGIVFVGGSVGALFYAVSLIPTNLDLRANWTSIFWGIQNFLSSYAENLKPIYDMTRVVLGEMKDYVFVLPLVPTLIRFLILLGSSALLLFAGVLIVRPLFYSMASKPFEYLKKRVKARKNHRVNSKLSCVINEFLKAFKDSSRMFSNIAITIAIPILIFFLNKVFYAMNTKEFGNQLVTAFNLLIILLIALNANTYAASIFSRDGRSAYLIKVQPTSPTGLLVAKLLPNTAFCIVSFAMTFGILTVSTNMSVLNCFLMMLGVVFIYLAHLLYCAETDIMNPQTEIYASMGEHENNPNESKATVTAFIIAFVVAIATLLLLTEGRGNVFLKFCLIGVGLFAYELWAFFSKIKLYYKEK